MQIRRLTKMSHAALAMVDKVLYYKLVARSTELAMNVTWNRGQKAMVSSTCLNNHYFQQNPPTPKSKPIPSN